MLASGILLEFTQVLRIMSWILLPALAIAFLVTIIHHYYHKKKNRAMENTVVENLQTGIDMLSQFHAREKKELHASFDRTRQELENRVVYLTTLVKELRDQLSKASGRATEAENKLESYMIAMKRIQHNIAECSSGTIPPKTEVIEMKAAYVASES